ncbi:MAG TPA: Mut7-C RNAse domain-containing protein [Pyrinomonadaceae bacterium]|nr:Mut7-C RNAse domain-containing protein [Pyrinomonadaceae bacterium]
MGAAFFRFYAELNDFLSPARRQIESIHFFEGRVSIKDMIESQGVPHTEVDLILVRSESVDFSYIVQDGDRISVYPVFEAVDITPLVRVRPHPLREVRFVLDNHLGKLATYLRLLGFDTLYRNDYNDEVLARVSVEEKRILLTRDRGLLKRGNITHGYCVRATAPEQQLMEVIRRFDLERATTPFNRCLVCNNFLESVSKEAVSERLLPEVREHYDDFQICRACDHIFWKGSHYKRMAQFVSRILQR